MLVEGSTWGAGHFTGNNFTSGYDLRKMCGASSVSNLFKFWRYQDPLTYYEVIRFLDVLVSKIANKGGWVIQHLLGILHFV